MSQLDDSRYRRQVRQQLEMRTKRNSTAPVMIPDSGVIPRFLNKVNGTAQPTQLGTTAFYQFRKSKENQGAKPVGSQRFPKSVRNPTQLTHSYLKRRPGSGATPAPQAFFARGGRA